MGRLWRRPVLGQSEIVCKVAILAVQSDTTISYRSRLGAVRSVARRALTLLNRRTLIVERTSGPVIGGN